MVDIFLDGGLQIKDVEVRRDLLLKSLETKQPVRVDISALASVDTAGVQLLLAFATEAAQRGIEVHYVGDSPALNGALSQLGLGAALPGRALS